ncbi:DoxX family membrane protein [Rhodococcus sp. I2R]|uniref:DoxX family membrane protein n=1 Tax=Rhodococcus sp. I2R TaxID=2855445 RepID=UPI001E639ADD|nr:DoxX family membrane protein [Rhodococcus sp. I2R]MCC8927634.1 DoxX family protein [Rhodococcus sp. I2R]
MLVRRIARPLMSTIFIAGGIDALRNPAPRAKAATPLIEQGKETLPNSVTSSVPEDPETLVRINGAIQVGGGILLATGKAPRIASIALAGSLVPTTLAGHAFWNETDPEAKAAQKIQFLKNVSLLGGLLIAAVDTEGKPSLAWRGRRAARKAQGTIAGALPGSHDASDQVGVASERVKELATVAASRGAHLADAAQPVVSKWADVATEKSSEFAEVAQPVLSRWAHIAADRGSDLAEVAQKRGSKWAEKAVDRGSELGDIAQKRSTVLADRAGDRTAELAELAQQRGSRLAEVAVERGQGLSKRALAQADKQSREFDKATEKARQKLEKKVEKARKDLDKRVQKYSK